MKSRDYPRIRQFFFVNAVNIYGGKEGKRIIALELKSRM
jgi:hypothetical protein